MKKLKGFVKNYRFPILSGLLIGTSYIPFPPWALLVCLAPLFYFWSVPGRSLKEIFIGGWITQFILTLIGFHWVAYTAHEFGHFPWPVAVIILLLFSALAHLYFPIAGLLWALIQRRLKLPYFYSIPSLAIIFALSEGLWPGIFNWNLGYPFIWAGLPIYQLSDIFGFQGLSTLVILANAWALGIALTWTNRLQFLKGAIALTLVFIGLNIWGHFHAQNWKNPDQSLRVLQVQGNIGNLAKHQAERGEGAQQSIIDIYFRLTRQGLAEWPETELVVWPETAFPSYLDQYYDRHEYNSQFQSFAAQIDTALLAGAYSRDPWHRNTEEKRRSYNAIFLFDNDGNRISLPYRKTHLLAFGEYFPGREILPQVEEWFPMVSNFGWGSGPMVLNLKGLLLGPQICYEGLDPHFSRMMTLQGAQILVNVTNDSWFGGFFEAYQHLYMTFARAIENRRPLIRNTNTGISSAILADGQILTQSPVGEEWTGHYKIDYYSEAKTSLYTLYGGWWTPLLFGLLFLLLAIGGVSARTSQSRLV